MVCSAAAGGAFIGDVGGRAGQETADALFDQSVALDQGVAVRLAVVPAYVRRGVLICCLSVLGFCPHALGAAYSDLAYEQLLRKARGSDRIAQYELARRYHIGHGVKKNYSEAAKWYRKSAQQGYRQG
jgi:hypothetical protein